MLHRRTLLAAAALAPLGSAHAQALKKVRIGQATPAVSFLPIMAARALDTFPAQGLDLEWAAIPGGDPACLAALDGDDIDLAAVGPETLLNAIAKGQPFQMVYSLMSKVSLELVVSNKLVERTGVSPADDSVAKRLQALKGATVGVSAIGGTQDRAARWLARQAKLDPRTDIQIAMAGPPPAIQAALEAGRIDAYVLSPPEGLITEDNRTGITLIRMGDEFPALKDLPSLVLAVKTPVDAARHALVVSALRALDSASRKLLADPASVGATIAAKLYPRIKPAVVQAAVRSLQNGIGNDGRFDPAGIENLLGYTADATPGITAQTPFWTNGYADEAAR